MNKLIIIMPAMRKFMPTNIPTTQNAVAGKPNMIMNPIINCKSATNKFVHQR